MTLPTFTSLRTLEHFLQALLATNREYGSSNDETIVDTLPDMNEHGYCMSIALLRHHMSRLHQCSLALAERLAGYTDTVVKKDTSKLS